MAPAGTLFMPGDITSSVVIKANALIVVDDRGTVVRFSELLAAWQAQQQKEAT